MKKFIGTPFLVRTRNKMYLVYILRSALDGTYYVGCTNNIKKRLKVHNSGLSKYTKTRKPWTLVYLEKYSKLSEARQREKQIKSWKKRVAIEKLITCPVRLAV